MSDADENAEQSMEEILQSIKRIIADDDEPEAEQPAAPEKVEMQPEGEDSVLELTEVVDEAEEALELTEVVEPIEPDAARMDPLPEPEPEPEPEPVLAVPAPESAKATAAFKSEGEGLVSDVVAQASADAFSSLLAVSDKAPASAADDQPLAFRSGVTVEDMVSEALKPLLQDWLNDNLQGIVEQMVQKEVKRITGQ